jgi:hypothetical protein
VNITTPLPRWLLIVAGGALAACARTGNPPEAVRTASAAPVAEECTPAADDTPRMTWPDAVVLLENGRVRAVSQTDCLEVRLDTVDGDTYYAKEPQPDEVLRLVDQSAPNGDTIIKAKE